MKSFFTFWIIWIISTFLCAENQDNEYITRRVISVKSPVQNIRFSPNGVWLAAGAKNGYVTIWDIKTGKLVKRFWGHNQTVNEVTFSQNGELIASAGADGLVNVWNIHTGLKVGTYRNKTYLTRAGQAFKFVSFVDFSKDGKYVYFGGDSGYIMRGEIGRKKQAQVVFSSNHPNGDWYFSITGGRVSEDGKSLIFCVGFYIYQIDLQNFFTKKKLSYPRNKKQKTLHLNDVTTGPFINGVSTWSYDGRVTFWNLTTSKKISSMQVSKPETYSTFSFDKSKTLMVTGADGKVAKVWDLQHGRQIAELSGHQEIIRTARFHPHKNLIATASYDGTIRIWEEKIEEILPALVSIKKIDPVNILENTPEKPHRVQKTIFFQEKLLTEGETINLRKVRFNQGSYILQNQAFDELQQLVNLMKKNRTLKIRLEGHTDNVGDPQKNRALARRRVLAAKNFLIMKGIYEQRIEILAYGGEKPLVENNSETNRKLNRRIELKILEI